MIRRPSIRSSQAEPEGVRKPPITLANPKQRTPEWKSSSTDKTGLYDCMIWYTRLPCIRRGGELIFDSDYLYDWFCCVTCPSARAVLKCEFSPYEDCPYVMFYMCHNAESMMGDCIPKMLDSLQSEMNAHARYGIDSLQYALTPMFKMRESVAQRNSGFQAFPGAVLVYEQSADEIQPLVMPQTQVSSLQYLQYLELEFAVSYRFRRAWSVTEQGPQGRGDPIDADPCRLKVRVLRLQPIDGDT